MIEDIKRFVLVQNQVIKLRRLAAETFDLENIAATFGACRRDRAANPRDGPVGVFAK